MKTRFLVVAGTVASALAMAGCKQEAKAPEPVRPVLSAVLQPASTDSTIAVGTVQPRYETNLGFRLLGRLITRPVNVGDLVAEGQTIAAIDPTALELAVRSANADLSKAEALLENAIGTEERKRILIRTDATTRQTLDDAEQIRAGAQASSARAREACSGKPSMCKKSSAWPSDAAGAIVERLGGRPADPQAISAAVASIKPGDA